MKNNKRFTKNTFSKKGKSKLVISAIMLAFIMILAPLYAFADGSTPELRPALGLSTIQIGDSTGYSVYTAEDLQAAIDLDDNGDYSKVVLFIEEDFSIGDVSEWIPLGSSEVPFNGTIEGQEHRISGVGHGNSSTLGQSGDVKNANDTLLGHLNGATIKDLSVETAKLDTESNPYYGLLITAENCTIINCHVYALNPLSTLSVNALMRSGFTADMTWLDAEYLNSTIVVDSAAKLWTVAEASSRSAYTFLDKEIEIVGRLDLENEPFKGIGDEKNPFKGSIKGTSNATIVNLNLEGVNPTGTGLVAYADGRVNILNNNPNGSFTTIKDIKIENVKGSGNSGVGALLGFGKNVVVENCSVSGAISGTNDVGTLIGRLELTAPFTNFDPLISGAYPGDEIALPYVLNCYSTADVSGATNIGGLVGAVVMNEENALAPDHYFGESDVVIKGCFTTGNINGTSQVGGVVGHTGGYISGQSYSLAVGDSASMSSINATVNAGGIIGVADTKKGGPVSDFHSVVNSYFAGTLKGTNFLGGLVGIGGDAKDSYVSGHVVTPLAFSALAEAKTWPISGNSDLLDSDNVYSVPNTVYRPGDPFNVGEAVAQFLAYTQGSSLTPEPGGTVNQPEYDNGFLPIYFTTTTTGTNISSSFTGGNLTSVTNTAGAVGTFPQLTALGTGEFSKISTAASITNFPSQFYVNANKEATNTPNGTAYPLPQGLGITWKIDVNGVDDNTLEGGKNKINIDPSTGIITLTDKVSQSFDAVITGNTPGGISVKFAVTFVDEAVRPIYDDVPKAYITDRTQASPGIIFDANVMSLSYPEGLSMTGTPLLPGDSFDLPLNIYSDGNFNTLQSTEADGAQVFVLSERVIKITFKKNLLKSDQSYSFKLDTGVTKFEDLAGNLLNTEYFFRTVSNSKPIITLDATHDLYAKNDYSINSINATKDEQVIGMIENDEDYDGHTEGVIIENPNGQLVDIGDNGSIVIINPTGPNMAGKENYEALKPKNENFYKIPGTYEVTYQVPDPEDPLNPAMNSNVAKRTYHVYSRAYFTRGGATYTTFTATFTATDMLDVYRDVELGLTVDKAVEKALIARYLTNAGSPDYLAAYHYDSSTAKQDLPITFDTSPITSNVFQDGFQSTLDMHAGHNEQSFVLEIQSTSPDFVIEVDNNTFLAINSLSRGEARKFFNARVRQKSTGKIVDYPIIYNFKNVNTNNYNVSQKVTLTMVYPSGITEINGIDMTVSKNVNVVMKRENKFRHPEDVDDIVGEFWTKASSDVKDGSKDKDLKYDLTYDEASRTPADFFLLVSNRGGKDIEMTLPTGIVLSFRPDLISKEYAFENGTELNMSIEPMYDVYVSRDVKGNAVQQFFTADEFNLPGGIGIGIPLDEGMPTENLNLYYIDEESNKYVLVDYIAEKQIKDGKLNLEMTQYQGRYVITEAELDGNYVGYVK